MAASLFRKLAGTLASSFVRPSIQTVSTCQLQKCCFNRSPGCFSLPAQRGLTHWTHQAQPKLSTAKSGSLLQTCQPFVKSVRTAVRFSIRRAAPKTVKSVPGRFFRLPWGNLYPGQDGG
ncbi:uncharacterized protein LOC132723677 [Ruditapes philippinarum]|uniref:uncharacterized protein LOC132723677 n=1 Tax=Ruditapes philippinarum TaxID=129788 RepID=UPI00295A8953|nr:uncharacterized protein LOC132723677 [Ruditapes philippinarum]